MKPFSIIIPTYNGVELLKRLIPLIYNLTKNIEDYEVLIVDDGSKDRTESYLKNYFPQIKVIALKKNVGFGKACNIGVTEAKHDLIFIMNNDVRIHSDFPLKILSLFDKPDKEDKILFAATCKVLKEGKKSLYYGRNEGVFYRGEIHIKPLSDEYGKTFFASGVIMAFHKEMFLELGGFDDLYHPFYWEDVDLCYRALKKGFSMVYTPNSLIYHKDQSTIVFRKKGGITLFFAKMVARIIQERNQYLFTWKNILDHEMISKHVLWIPIHLFLSLRNKDHIFKSIGFLFALIKIKKALKKRKEEKKNEYLLKDRFILGLRD